MTMALDASQSFSLLTNVTPFTYRDGETFLQILKRLRKWIHDAIIELEGQIQDTRDEDQAALDALAAQFNAQLAAINTLLIGFQTAGIDDVVFDPTTGTTTAIEIALGHVYDNTRYYAYFADQLDDFEKTAAQWDNMQYTARHFDLALAYSPSKVQADDLPTNVQPN